MGRRKIPTHIQEAKGAYKVNPGRKNHDEPVAVESQPLRSDLFKGKREAQKKWKQLVRWQNSLRLNSEVDSDILVRYALTWEIMCNALEEIDELGFIIRTEVGTVKSNPATATFFSCQATLDKLSSQLGIGASNRASLKAHPKTDDADPFLDFVKRATDMSN